MSLTQAIIKEIVNETPDSKHFGLQIADNRAVKSYQTPGQWVIIRLPNFPEARFALSNIPDDDWSVLIKKSSPLTKKLLDMKKGDRLDISKAQGEGFDVKQILGKDILLFATGSGIAPIRAVIHWMAKNRDYYGNINLYYGARTPRDFAYKREFADWEKNKIVISRIISNAESKNWNGPYGFVQKLIPPQINIQKTVALLCGVEGMISEVREELTSRGLPDDAILTNH